MRKIALILVLLALFACPSFSQTTMNWDSWLSVNWTPSWTYDASWTAPDPASFGFTRASFGSNYDTLYQLRYMHYYYTSNNNPGLALACGPETYLTPSLLCARKPLYWNIAVSGGSTCVPDTFFNGARISCESTNPGAACCYRSNAVDLLNIDRLSKLYPPGSSQCCSRTSTNNLLNLAKITTTNIYN